MPLPQIDSQPKVRPFPPARLDTSVILQTCNSDTSPDLAIFVNFYTTYRKPSLKASGLSMRHSLAGSLRKERANCVPVFGVPVNQETVTVKKDRAGRRILRKMISENEEEAVAKIQKELVPHIARMYPA